MARPRKTSPYEFFQYWRNIDDADVEKCLKLLTEIDLDEIAELCRYKDERMNRAKEVLAYELTKLVHGKDDADLSLKQSKGAFGDGAEMPEKQLKKARRKSSISLSQSASLRAKARLVVLSKAAESA